MSGRNTSWGADPDNLTGWPRRIIGSLRLGLGWLFICLIMPVVIFACLLSLRTGVDRWFHLFARLLGRTVLWLGGVRLDVRGGEAFAGRRTRIFLMNHASQLDLFIMAAVMPPGAGPIGKKEFVRIPFIGWAWWALDLITIDRSNLDRAKASMAKVSRRLTERQGSIIIAPEGTRSRDGGLGPFKMGAFHLAAEVDAPIIPVVIRGAASCQPMGNILINPGVIRIDVLEEIPTVDFSKDNLHAQRDAMHSLFETQLAIAAN